MANAGSSFKPMRLLALVIVLIAALSALFLRVVWIQIFHGSEYSAAAYAQQTTTINRTLKAKRGSILDANGNVLAKTETTYDVIIDPMALQSHDKETQQAAMKELARILNIRHVSFFDPYMTAEYADSQYERFAGGYGISEAVKAQIQAKIDDGHIVGVWLEPQQSRTYPNNALAAHVIGFNGAYGLEAYYDEELSGKDGRYSSVTPPNGKTVETVEKEQNGYTLCTSLKTTVEYYLEQSLEEAMKDQDCERVCGIIMNPKTGAIYAMADFPSFNLNDVEEVIGLSSRYTPERQKEADFLPSVWNNFAVSGTYQPGSTFKPIFASIALDSGSIAEYDTFYCEGSYSYYDQLFKCADYDAHGEETIRDVIQHSCNIGMIQVSTHVSIRSYLQYQKAYGLGQRTGIDLPGEATAEYLIYNEDNMGPVELATTAFGQGFNLTPIQLLAAECAVVNNGYLMQPHLVEKIIDENGNTVYTAPTEPLRQVVSAYTSSIVRDGMEAVAAHSSLADELAGYRIGGKTGTAEQGDYAENRYVISFTAFAPIDDPEVGLLIVMDEAASNSSRTAVEVGGKVLANVLPYLNIYPEE